MSNAITKTVSLNISERMSALNVLNSFKGNLDKLALIFDDIKQFAVSAEEWEKAEKVQTPPDAEGNYTINWNDEKGGEKEITITEATLDYLRDTIKEKNEKGEFTVQDKAFITLKTKLA